jgi:uncharacterized coiled-coil protein SlyX
MSEETTAVIKSLSSMPGKNTMIHIGAEICTFIAVFAYFRNVTNKLSSTVDELNITVANNEIEIKKLHGDIKRINEKIIAMESRAQTSKENFVPKHVVTKRRRSDDDDDSILQYRTPDTITTTLTPPPRQPVPVREQPVQEQPVREQPVQEQPVREQPVQEQPVREQPVREQPVREQPVEQGVIDLDDLLSGEIDGLE